MYSIVQHGCTVISTAASQQCQGDIEIWSCPLASLNDTLGQQLDGTDAPKCSFFKDHVLTKFP